MMKSLTLVILSLTILVHAEDGESKRQSGVRARLGFNINRIAPDSIFPLIATPQSVRFWNDGTGWSSVNPHPGVYEWAVVDWWTHNLREQGVNDGLFVLGGGGTPGFAKGNPIKDLNADGTGTNQYWREWVKNIAEHFKSSPVHISKWEIWNEFIRESRNDPGGQSWSGTNRQMLRLAEDARCIIVGRGGVTATGESCRDVLDAVGLAEAVDPLPCDLTLAKYTCILSPSFYRGPLYHNWQSYWKTPGVRAATEGFEVHIYNVSPEGALANLKEIVASLPPLPVIVGETSCRNVLCVRLDEQQKADFLAADVMGLLTVADAVYIYSYNNPTKIPLADSNKATLAGHAVRALLGQ